MVLQGTQWFRVWALEPECQGKYPPCHLLLVLPSKVISLEPKIGICKMGIMVSSISWVCCQDYLVNKLKQSSYRHMLLLII